MRVRPSWLMQAVTGIAAEIAHDFVVWPPGAHSRTTWSRPAVSRLPL